MEYNYVVKWSQENGWQIDWDTTDARFPEGNVWAPNLDEWLRPVDDSETGDIEIVITNELDQVFAAINEK